MAYTTTAKIKDGLPLNYEDIAEDKLTQDGWIVSDVFDETGFLTKFMDLGAQYIDDFIGGGPFEAHGVLDDINKAYALYHIELYIISATVDRVMSITIYDQWKQARQLLKEIRDGDILVTPSGSSSANAPGLIEPDDDGITLGIGDMESDLFFGDSDATEIPE